MVGEEKTPIPFPPLQIHSIKTGFLVLGMDGEMQCYNESFVSTTDVMTPFPCKITHSTVVDMQFIGTWLDYDVLIGRMAAIQLDQPLIQGPTKSEVRRAASNQTEPPHPAGHIWSRALNADVTGLVASDDGVIFSLWKRGVYKLDLDANEAWRAPLPRWVELNSIPGGDEILTLHDNEKTVLVVSKGAGFVHLSKEDGMIESQGILSQNISLQDHFFQDGQHLLVTTNHEIVWINNEDVHDTVQLSGPVQSALYDNENGQWYIAGWREVLIIGKAGHTVTQLDEVCNDIIMIESEVHVVTNNGQLVAINQ